MFIKAISALVLWLLFAPAHAQDVSPIQSQSVAAPAQEPRQLTFASLPMPGQQPSMQEVQLAFDRSTLTNVSTQVVLTIDAQGKIQKAALARTTSSRALDKEIMRWARQLKLGPGFEGIGILPITLVKYK